MLNTLSDGDAGRPRHLLTGATGFVGGAILLELLRQTEDDVVVLIRPRPDQTATQRLHATLATLAEAYAPEPSVLADAARRCRAVAGDVTQPLCGVREADLPGGVAQLWHCAASLRYEDRYADEIRAANIDGTRQALALADRLGVGAFNYVSTAYVAGQGVGRIPEALVHDVQTNNCYEQSKLEAEHLVAARGGLTRILRPSIVIGHSQTLAATTFSGLYGFLRQLRQLRGMTDRAQDGLLQRLHLRVRAQPDGTLNFIPVDAVALHAVRIGLRDTEGGVFHLTSADPPAIGMVMDVLFECAGLSRPILVDELDGFTWLEQRLDQRIDFYRSYLRGHKRFERRRSDASLGAAAVEAPLTEARLRAYSRWYLERLERERARLPVNR